MLKVSLKELLDFQKVTGCSDIDVIRLYFTENNKEELGIELVYDLSKSKIDKLRGVNNYAKEWINVLPSRYLYENYDLELADKLHNLELNFIVNGGRLSEGFLKWAEENIPNIEDPGVYFRPLVEWMNEKGIKFK